MEFIREQDINEAVGEIKKVTSLEPEIGMILGSGLGPLAGEIEGVQYIKVETIPGWPVSTVEGHSGKLAFGHLEGVPVLALQGRAHYYEGHPIGRLGLPVRVMQKMGAGTLIVTNAAGAVHPDFTPGELMLISDHLNLIGMAGLSPLRGPNLDAYGPRFPDMSLAYDPKLRSIARSVAEKGDIPLQEGVYACLAGPSYETPADLRFLRGIGVDAVGMSTVPEVIIARHGGMRVMGVSGISNKANLDGTTVTTHDEVLAAGEVIVPRLTALVRGVLKEL